MQRSVCRESLTEVELFPSPERRTQREVSPHATLRPVWRDISPILKR